MPHSREVRATSHDRHDPILVAALAAGDLAGTDRDQAIELTRSCADCAVLHDDLLALARATAAAPPPFAMGARDFQLSPADAARLRPGGWRRLVGALSGARSGLSRPLGVGLATLGLAGLLIGNVQIDLGGSAARPEAASSTAGGTGAAVPAAPNQVTMNDAASAPAEVQAGPAAASSGTEAYVPAPAASANDVFGRNGAKSTPGGVAAVPAASAGGEPSKHVPADMLAATVGATDTDVRPLNLVLGAAVVLGLVLVVLSFRRRPAA